MIGGGALFAAPEDRADERGGMAWAPMGTRTGNGRYKMPATLPGDVAPQKVPAGQEPWVSGGIQSMTNLAGSISDTRALGIWETQQALIGLGLNADLQRDLVATVRQGEALGVNFQALREHPDFREALISLAERAKDVSGGNKARDAGIYRHEVWEQFCIAQGKTLTGWETGSALFGGATPEVNAEIQGMAALLDAAGFEIMPELVERTVRNTTVQAAGRFDNILLHRRTGKLYMADLKTKAKPFWGFLEIDAQLAGYANSEWMLHWNTPVRVEQGMPEVEYTPGPREHVDLTEGVVLHMPSAPGPDGSQEPRLRRADLAAGWRALQLARQVCEVRSYGKSAGRERASYWPVG